MTVREVIQHSAQFLEGRGVDSPRLQGELLLAHVLGLPRLQLYLNFERPLTEGEVSTTRELVRRRGRREPLQHIVGSANFCGLEMRVTPDVLIPRPETELLAERALTFLKERCVGGNVHPPTVTVLDVGTGSGCLSIYLAYELPPARVTTVDISPAALTVARENARRHGVSERISFVEGDVFSALAMGQEFDLIVSNPPYIPSAEMAALEPEVRDHDPRLALDGGADGLDFYRRIAAGAPPWLKPGGRLMLELGHDQAAAVREICERQLWIVEGVEADYSRVPRILVARRG